MPFEASIAIMCGGRGRRLGNLTKEIPKPLVKLNGKTILEWKLEHYANQSYFDNILCIGYQGEKIKKHIKPRFNHVNFNNSGTKAGILKRLFDVRDKLQPISIISYGDTFAKLDIENLIKKHVENKVLITLVVAPVTNPFGILKWNDQKFITSFEEKPVLNHFIGYFAISTKIFEFIPEEVIKMPDGNGIVKMLQILIALKQARVYEFNGLKFTFNTPFELADARRKAGEFFTLDENNNEK